MLKREMDGYEITINDTGNWMVRILRSGTFAKIPSASLQKIFMRMEPVPVKAGDTIIKQGEAGDYYYVIESGHCLVSRIPLRGKAAIKLAELGPGEGFGEEALIAGTLRNATVEMLTDGQLMRLKTSDFNELIKEPLLQPVGCVQASSRVEQGTRWLDIRSPEEFSRYAIAGSINIDLCTLRIQFTKLSKDQSYIICSDSPVESALAAFLLIEKGFDACPLSVGVKEYLLYSAKESVTLGLALIRGDTLKLDALSLSIQENNPQLSSAGAAEQILPSAYTPITPEVTPEVTSIEPFTIELEQGIPTEISGQLEFEIQEFKKELEERFEEYKAMMLKQLQKRAVRIELAYRKRYLEKVQALRDQYESSKCTK